MTDTIIEVGRVAMVKTSGIEIIERYRCDMGNTDELEDSIKRQGLMQPLAVYKLPNSSEYKYRLIAGGRRMSILLKHNVENVPVRIFDKPLTEQELKSLELAENIYRKDFTWDERARLERDIHKLQIEIHGEKKSTSPDAPGASIASTAKMINRDKASLSTSIKLAEALDKFPEMFEKCKNQSDAVKTLNKMEDLIINDMLAKKVASTTPKTLDANIRHSLSNSFINMDCITGMRSLQGGIFNLVEIDPPYAIDLRNAKMGNESSGIDSYNEVEDKNYIEFLMEVLRETYRVMSDHSWLIFWFAPEPWFEVVHNLIEHAGFQTTRMCGTWCKPNGQSKRPELHLANTYEMFFYAWKGRPVMNCQGRGNQFRYPTVNPNDKRHPTERPIELMEDIYSTFAMRGSRVLIPFLGSGNGLIAARRQGMKAIGYELSTDYKNSFVSALEKIDITSLMDK